MCECERCKQADKEIEKVDAARASAASAGYGIPKRWLIRIAAELVRGDFLPSSMVDDYPQKTYAANRVAQMMEQPRETAKTMAYNLRQIADLLP